jgi:tRNA threonylcarbamoyladenosine biosynthesis protein TsaB
MLILGIETSGRAGEIALMRDETCLAERTLQQAGRRHAQTLAAEVQDLLQEFNVQPADCEAVAVSIGPGSFTGLRVGVVFAKTWAYATGCQLAAVDTFLAIAANSPADVAELAVIADAQRGDLFVGRYHRGRDDAWTCTDGVRICNAAQWMSKLQSDEIVSGPGVDKYEDQLRQVCRVLDPSARHPRAVMIARLGMQRIETGPRDAPWRLEPFYLRKSAAEEKWEGTRSQSADDT